MYALVGITCISESKHVFTAIGHLCCGTLTGLHSDNRVANSNAFWGFGMLGYRVEPQWELGMAGPKINWRVCTLLKIPI